jgi:crotonobetaine/carnitine-CoA ligase
MNANPPAWRREDIVQRHLLERWAREVPERVFAVHEDGTSWTYGATLQTVRATASALQALGVRQGDHVLVWLPNGADFLRTWFAINHIGAVCVTINTAYRGGLLEHVVRNSGARLMVSIAPLIERLADVAHAQLERAVSLAGPPVQVPGLMVMHGETLNSSAPLQPLQRPIEPWDTQSIYYTSGTTGPSKGVVSSYMHLLTMARSTWADRDGQLFVDHSDRCMVNLPLFHAGGLVIPTLMLALGGSVNLLQGFDTASFWTRIAETRTTCVILLGVMAAFLVKQPAREGERETPLRHAICLPLTEESLSFHRRFGVRIHTVFNMSEISSPLVSDMNPDMVGSCGKTRSGMQTRVVDENDIEVPVGTVGELLVRGDQPWTLATGYNDDTAATARAWRNGWFHTGDAFRQDAQENHFFVDRMKDAIRRRGENISSFEVESALLLHPAVMEAAAVGVPSPESEDDLLVAISLVQGQTLDPAALIEFMRPRVAHFMIPRYIRMLPELPKTPTQKVQKFSIRAEGVTADTWDREASGIHIGRERFDRKP